MAASGSFRIEGLRELEKDLVDLAENFSKANAKNALKRALVKALTPMEGDAEAHAPELTGALKAGFSVGTKLSSRQMATHRKEVGSAPVMTINGWRSNPSTAVYVFMGPTGSPKSIVQEFGSINQAPHPYMRPAWDSNHVPALESVKDHLTEEIEKTRARIARKAAKQLAKMTK